MKRKTKGIKGKGESYFDFSWQGGKERERQGGKLQEKGRQGGKLQEGAKKQPAHVIETVGRGKTVCMYSKFLKT